MARHRPRKRRRVDRSKGDGLNLPDQQPQVFVDTTAEKAMSIMLIAKEVFNFLSVKDLASCSEVNRTWSRHAREVLRENKMFIARIETWSPCSALKDLNALLEFSQNIPINGLHICIHKFDHNDCINCTGDEVYDLYSVLLTRIKIKYLQIDWGKESICPALGFIKKLFQDKSANFIELKLLRLPPTIVSLVSRFEVNLETREYWLPNVVTLEFPGDLYDLHTSVAKELIFATPKLTKFIGNVLPPYLEYIVQKGKTGAVQELALKRQCIQIPMTYPDADVSDAKVEEYLQSTLKFAEQNPRIKKMLISTYGILLRCTRNSRHEKLSLISQILKAVLLSSSNYLEDLCICHLDLIHLSSAHIVSEPLSSVKHLTIDYCKYLDVRKRYSTLRKIDFQTMFPNLESVKLVPASPCLIQIYVTNEFLENLSEYSCATVTTLKIGSGLYISEENISFFIHYLAKAFPSVKSFRMDSFENLDAVCTALWTAWSDIESIVFTRVSEDSLEKNLDCCFTGRLKRRVCKTLRSGKTYGSFEEFITDESRSSIRNLKKLKQFRVDILHWSTCQQNDNTKEAFLSEVAGHAFLEMPQLTVEIARHVCSNVGCRFALNHLDPFLKLVNYNGWLSM